MSGEVKPGQLLAIMGSRSDVFHNVINFNIISMFSGAGKTTLLNVLTARNLSEVVVKGIVKLNGRVANTNTIISLSAYVQQINEFLPVFTVREHLVFQVLKL